MPRFSARAAASVLLWPLENLDGIEIPQTRELPRASTASAATSAESIPPLNPTSTFFMPHLFTKSRRAITIARFKSASPEKSKESPS